jgi:uncharacterized protein (TIGR02145 family)
MKKFLFVVCIVSFCLFEGCKDKSSNPNNPPIINFDTVRICNQIWMKKNLDVDHYRNGDSIPEVRDSAEWTNLTIGAWCYYNNDTALGRVYGKLYNGYTVTDPRGLAPEGWHIPSDAEWKELEMCLGMSQSVADEDGRRGTDEGGKMKETGTVHWDTPNNGATNESGFTAIPGGCRYKGSFGDIGGYGSWISSTAYNNSNLLFWFRYLNHEDTKIIRYNCNKNTGNSVRCIKNK